MVLPTVRVGFLGSMTSSRNRQTCPEAYSLVVLGPIKLIVEVMQRKGGWFCLFLCLSSLDFESYISRRLSDRIFAYSTWFSTNFSFVSLLWI